ncbi:MAG: Ig-like domain-containing protein [Clostridia bacterium]|nr:Ig-like domain-containing protein [Clostridia bacterium]
METSIALNVTSADLNIWETLDLSVVPAQADTTISWSSSDPLVARVDDKGHVEALRVGTATITAITSDKKEASCVVTVTDSYEDFDARFKVPYVATYYFNPKPSINDTIQIPLYISDYENSDYMFEDSSVTLDIIYKVDNNPEMTVKNVPLGDYTITLGKLSEGMHTFSVKVRDNRTGLDSAVLYNDLWVLKNSTSETVAGKTYVMQQSDLTKYSIVLQNKNATTGQFTPELTETQCLNNRNGLNQMFTDLKANGYTKVVLVKGIYRIDGEQRPGTPDSQPSSVWIPTNFTVDMNGSTFKLNTITSENPGCIVSFYDTVDSHLTNGTLEGDRFERKALGLETGTLGERISTVRMYGGKYNSIINVNVQNSTSYAFFKTYTYPTRNVIRNYESGAIDPATGNLVSAPDCSTSSYMDLSEWRKNDQLDKYMYVGHPDGLRGVWSDSVIVYVSFYGANKNYLETVTAMQFRKILVPDNAQYCRVTVLGTNIDTGYNGECNLAIYDHHLGDYCEVKNCNFIDTRACAMAPAVACHILIEGCTFTRCGNSITAIAVDFEDGGEECMDVFYRNNTVLESAGNGTVISNRGFNHIFENCTNHSFEFRHGVYGLTVRNMTDPRTSVTFQLGDRKHQAYMRVYDNNFSVYRTENRAQNGKWTMDFIIRDCTISTESFNNLNDRMRFENCTITSLGGGNSVFNNCTIQSLDRGNIAGELYFYNCTFKNLGQGDPFLKWTWQSDFNRVFENCTFEGTTRMNGACSSALFRGCVFNNLEYMASATLNSTTTSIVFDSCEINSSAGSLLTTGPLSSYAGYINVIFKNCTITHTGNNLINLFAKPIDDSQIVFVNCVINKTSGVLVTGNNGFNVAGSLGSQFQQYANRAAIKIIFNKTPVNPNLPIDTKNVNTNWAKIVYEN